MQSLIVRVLGGLLPMLLLGLAIRIFEKELRVVV
jgi:hypothetical protein